MYRYIITTIIVFFIVTAGAAMPADDITDMLTRAESLYFGAKFQDAVQLLKRIEEMLQKSTDRPADKITVKVQLALAYIGLNDTEHAKASLRELYALDPKHSLDPQEFAPKVLALAREAQAEGNELRCESIRGEARKYLESRSVMPLVNLIESTKSGCSGLQTMETDAAGLFYKTAVEAYKAGRLSEALENFRWTLKLAPNHELAAQYLDLTERTLRVDADRQLLEWHKDLQAHEFNQAAVLYGLMKASKDGPSPQILDQMRTEYRDALEPLVQSWNRSCRAGDAAAMESIREQLPEHLPDASLGDDLLAQVMPCAKKECTPVSAPLALARLKVRVNPVVPPPFRDLLGRSQFSVRVKTRIDEKGDVTVLDVQGVNSLLNKSVREAVEHWKFDPFIDDPSGARCAEVDFAVVIKP